MYFNAVLQTQIKFLRKVVPFLISYHIYFRSHDIQSVLYLVLLYNMASFISGHLRFPSVLTIFIHGIRQKERNTNKKFVRHFLIRNVPHFYGLPLDLCGNRIAALFAKRAAIFANALQFGETCCVFTGKADGFTRWRTFRNSVKVRHTQRDKRSAWYAALISAAAACLLHSF